MPPGLRPRTPDFAQAGSRRIIVDLVGVLMLASFSLCSMLAPIGSVLPAAAPAATRQPALATAPPASPAAGSGTPAALADDTAEPCAPDQRIATTQVSHVEIKSYCGIPEDEQQQVAKYVQDALDAMPPGLDPTVELFVLSDVDAAARVQYDWLRVHGWPDASYGEVLKAWDDVDGKANPGVVVIYIDQRDWWSKTSAGIGEVVLHEMHHITQFELAGSDELPVDWLTEGGAEYFTYAQLYSRSSSSPRVYDNMQDECVYPLADLVAQSDAFPPACLYVEGERAVAALVENFGEAKYYDLFRGVARRESFSTVFTRTYGITLAGFYEAFDAYRKSNYHEIPALAPTTP